MKKIKVNFEKIKVMSNTEKFKAIFLIIIFCSLICSRNIPDNVSYENAILYYSSTGLYQIFLFVVMFISSIFTMSMFDKGLITILRFKDKRNYLENMLFAVSLVNILVYLLFSIIGILFVTLNYAGNINFGTFIYYNIPFFTYNIFIYVKYFIIINLLILICIIICKNFGKIFGSLLLIVIIILKENYVYIVNSIESYSDFRWFYGYYLYPFQHSNLMLELSMFLLEALIIMIVLQLLKYLCVRFNKLQIID